MASPYIERILKARVYDVAVESPLEEAGTVCPGQDTNLAGNLSDLLGVSPVRPAAFVQDVGAHLFLDLLIERTQQLLGGISLAVESKQLLAAKSNRGLALCLLTDGNEFVYLIRRPLPN